MSTITNPEIQSMINFIKGGYSSDLVSKKCHATFALPSINGIAVMTTENMADQFGFNIDLQYATLAISLRAVKSVNPETFENFIQWLQDKLPTQFSEDKFKMAEQEYRHIKSELAKVAPVSLEEGIKLENVFVGSLIPPHMQAHVDTTKLYADLVIGVQVLQSLSTEKEDFEGEVRYIVNIVIEENVVDQKKFNSGIQLVSFVQELINSKKPSTSSLILH